MINVIYETQKNVKNILIHNDIKINFIFSMKMV